MSVHVAEPIPAQSGAAMIRQPVVVAMLTYRRPGDLAHAIPAVLEQSRTLDPPATLMIVDNDPDGSARDAVHALGARDVRYVHEPRPGIAAARNRALSEAPVDAVLIFIDDDERPHDRWLELLLATYDRYSCAAVVGPVISEYETVPDEWIIAGRFFDRRRLPTGSRVDVAATNNLLLDLRQVHDLNLRFDEKFGESGGSDTLFTRRLHAAGRAIIWCDEAVVTDAVPATRLTRDWVLRRAFRSGNSWIRVSLEMTVARPTPLVTRLQGVALGGLRILGGTARYLFGVLARSTGQRVRGLRTIARGAGMASAALGYTYREYRRQKAG